MLFYHLKSEKLTLLPLPVNYWAGYLPSGGAGLVAGMKVGFVLLLERLREYVYYIQFSSSNVLSERARTEIFIMQSFKNIFTDFRKF